MRGVLGFQARLASVRPQLSNPLPLGIKLTGSLRRESTAGKPASRTHLFVGGEGEFKQKLRVQIVPGGVQFNIGTTRRDTLPSLWLRDNCRCSKCVNQDTMQRNFDTFKIKPDIHPIEATKTFNELKILWEDQHESEYPWSFIDNYLQHDSRKLTIPFWKWFGERTADHPPTAEYTDVMKPDDSGVGDLTAKIRKYGFAFVNNTPCDDPQDTKRLLERIAFIRETHYGGFYDFTPDLSMADTAYTNLALPAHTDTTYFTDPAGLQSFHLLSHTAAPSGSEQPEGGKSLLVDGFRAASILKSEDPEAYTILSSVRLPWHASGNEGITIAPDKRYPVLELDDNTDELHRVRWNNDDRGVVPWDNGYSPERWYAAARKWNDILTRPQMQCWIQLVPGKVLVFDNWRVLHGREAFTGVRRICGAYINRDDFISRWRNTNFERGELLKIVG